MRSARPAITRRQACASLLLAPACARAGTPASPDKGIACAPVQEARWGSITRLRRRRGGEIGLHQPRHPLAIAGPGA